MALNDRDKKKAVFKKRLTSNKEEKWESVDEKVAMAYSDFFEKRMSFEQAVKKLIGELSPLA